MRRRIRIAIVFAVGAALAAGAAWSGSPAYLATSNERVEVIVLVLAGLPGLARRLFGPAERSRTDRALRVCAYAAILALIPARNVLGQIFDVRPRAGLDLRVYRLVEHGGP